MSSTPLHCSIPDFVERMQIKVSIVIPCYNEANYIRECLESIIENEYPKDRTEVLVVDGMSSDGTREIVKKFIDINPYIRLLDNPRRIVPCALNIGVREATGEIIMRMDAHTTYPKDYISRIVHWLVESGVDNVGGICITRPGAATLIAQTIALALSSSFGVGNARFRTTMRGNKPRYVDTVPFGAYKREVLEKTGLFDERLTRNQDIEFNKRLIKAGGKILLVPEIVSYYHARPSLRALWQNNFANGLWVISAAKVTEDLKSLSSRHFVPLVFVSGLFVSIVVALFVYFGKVLLIAIAGSYLSLALFFAGKTALKNGLRYFFMMPLVFFTLHFSYGLGSLWGVIKECWVKE